MLTKQAKIELGDNRLFLYVALDAGTRNYLEAIQKELAVKDAPDIDHVTVLYLPKLSTPLSPHTKEVVRNKVRSACTNTPTINANIQGWAYFDGAKKDGEAVTALVALLDAPGLEDLHVEVKDAVRATGLGVKTTHGFNPHITIAWLRKGERLEDLPILDKSVPITSLSMATNDIEEFSLKGSLGVKAASVGLFYLDVKEAAHAHDRIRIRTKIDPKFVKHMERFCNKHDLPKIKLYHPLMGGTQGYITMSPIRGRHVVTTVLAPHMKPKGVPLTSVTDLKIPEPKYRKEPKIKLDPLETELYK